MHVWARVALRLSERELAAVAARAAPTSSPTTSAPRRSWACGPCRARPPRRSSLERVGAERFAPLPLAARERAGRRSRRSPRPRRHRAADAAPRLRGALGAVTSDGWRRGGVRRPADPARAAGARAPLVFLCASTFETLRIMLGRRGIGDSSGLLGRGGDGPRGDGHRRPAPGRTAARTRSPTAPPGPPACTCPCPSARSGSRAASGAGPSWYMLAHGRDGDAAGEPR